MWFGWLIFACIGFFLGKRYADLQTVLMARRVALLTKQRAQIADEVRQEEEIERQLLDGSVFRARRIKVGGLRRKSGDD